MIGLNKNLLSAMAGVTEFASNPAVAGTGIALGAGGLIYKLIKDTKESDAKFISAFNSPAKLRTNLYTQMGRNIPDSAIPRAQLAATYKIVSLLEQSNSTSSNPMNQKVKERDLWDKFININSRFNPLFQIGANAISGLSPKAMQKVFGSNKDKIKKEKHDTRDRAEVLGINLKSSQLLGMSGYDILRRSGNSQLSISAAIFDMNKIIAENIIAMRIGQGFKMVGPGHTIPRDDIFSKIAKIPEAIMGIPGLNAVGNIAKSGAKLLFSPFKMMTDLGIFTEKIIHKVKDIRFGGLFKAQDEADLAKRAKFKVYDFIKSDSFPALLNSMDDKLGYAVAYLKKLVESYAIKNKLNVDMSDIEERSKRGPAYYSKYKDELISQKQMGAEREEMISRAYGGLVGNTKKVLLALVTREKNYDEAQRRMAIKAYGKVIKEKNHASLMDRIHRPESRLAGVGVNKGTSVGASLGEDIRTTEQVSGKSMLWGGVGATVSMGTAAAGLALTLAGAGPLALIGGLVISALTGSKFDDKFKKIAGLSLKKRLEAGNEGDNPLNLPDNIGTNTAVASIPSSVIPFTPSSAISPTSSISSYFRTNDVTDGDQLIFRGLANIWFILQNDITNFLRDIKNNTFNMYTGNLGLSDNTLAINELKDAFTTKFSIAGKYYKDGTPYVPGKPGSPVEATVHAGERILTSVDNKTIVETITSLNSKEKNQIEKSRWDKLLDAVKGTKEVLTRGKIGMYLRDFWEDLKFKKKKKPEGEGSSSGWMNWLTGGLLAGGAWLIKKLLGSSLLNNKLTRFFYSKMLKPIARFYGDSLKLLIGDAKNIFKWMGKGIWKLVGKPIKAVGSFIVDKFKDKILTPFKGVFSRVGTYLAEIGSKIGLTSLFKGGGEGLLSKITTPVFKFFGNIGERIAGFAGKIGLSGLFKGEGFIGKLIKPVVEGIGNIAGRLFGSGGFLKGAGKIGLGFLKRLPGINFLFGAWDAVSGWSNAEQITGQKNPSFFHKLGAGVAGVVSGLTFGIVEPKTIYDLFGKAADWISEKTKGFGTWFMNTGPMKTIKDFFGYTDKDENPERSFISRAWEKFAEISKDSFNYLCDVPYLGAPLRLIRDAYDYLFGEKEENGEIEPSFVSKAWTKFIDIGDKAFDFMKTVPFIGAPFRILSDAYDFFFGEKPESPEKTILDKMIEFFKNISVDSILTTIIGPSWTTVKSVYEKVSGKLSSSLLPSTPTSVSAIDRTKFTDNMEPYSVPSKGIIDNAKELGSKALSGAKDLGGKAWEGAKDLGGKAWEGAKDLGGKAWEKTKQFAGDVGSGVMNGIDSVKKMIQGHEGTKYRPYKDSLGLWTVGVGHLIGDGKTLPPEMNREFSKEEVDQMFNKDFDEHAKAASKIPGFTKMNDTGKAALIDLTFNMGKAWYKKWPNLMKTFESGDYNKAADNLMGSKWYKQVKGRAKTIVAMIREAGSSNKADAKQSDKDTLFAEGSVEGNSFSNPNRDYDIRTQTRSSQNVQSVGLPDLPKEINELRNPPIPQTNNESPIAIAKAQTPITVNNISAPTSMSRPDQSKFDNKVFSPDPQFAALLDGLFNSAISGFSNAGKSFVFGEMLNANTVSA